MCAGIALPPGAQLLPPLQPQLLLLLRLFIIRLNSPMRQNMVQKDMQAQPIDSGSAASSPTLLNALGSVSMICPTCMVRVHCQ